MKGSTYYGSNDPVQGSFKRVTHYNLAIAGTASTTPAIVYKEIIVSLTVACHVRTESGDATTSDFVLPAGVWPLLINNGDTVSVIQLTGGNLGQASVIIPEEK